MIPTSQFYQNNSSKFNIVGREDTSDEYKKIIIPSGTIIENAKIDWNGIEFIVPKENQHDFGSRNAKFGEFEIISIIDRTKEANVSPWNELQKTINGYNVTYGTIVKARLIKDIESFVRFKPVIYTATSDNSMRLPPGAKKEEKKQKNKIQTAISNPFKEGFKKYVVIEDFVAENESGDKKRNFKRGMNLYAREELIWGDAIGFVSYAGFLIDRSKVSEKKPNVYEKIQQFFTIRKGFTQ
jgi:hypothetical protein